jgi:phospholipid-binding lipoprotein MlaA
VATAGLVMASAGSASAQDAASAQPPSAQPPSVQAAGQVPRIPDPWERANRGLFHFSMSVDHAVIAPVIHVYRTALPGPVQSGVKNVVYNLDEPRTFANDVLQLRFGAAGRTTIRFVVNSTVGLAGLIDVADKTGVPRHDSDFGQTLGRYGVGTGPYVFVPFAGPSDVRDGVGRIIDAVGDPVAWAFGGLNTPFGAAHDGLKVVQARVDVDDQLQSLDRDFTDPYATLHSAYAQNRAYKIQEAKGVTPQAQVNDLPDFGSDAPSPPQTPAKP